MAELYRSDICNVDISKSLLRTYAGIVLATGDKNANRFGANIFRAGDPVDISGCTVLAYFIRPNMDTLPIDGAVEGNTVYVDLPAACYTHDGAFSLAIKISGADITQTVRVVDGCIRQTQTDNIVDPGEVVPSLDALYATIADMEVATAAAEKVAADAAETAADAQATSTEAKEIAADAAMAVQKDAGGAIVTVTDGAARPAVTLAVQINSACDAVSVTRTGANLFGGAALADALAEGAGAVVDAAAGTVSYTSPKVHDLTLFDGFEAGKQYTVMLTADAASTSATANMRVSYTDGTNDVLRFGGETFLLFTSAAGKTVAALTGYNSSGTTILLYEQCGVFEGVVTDADFVAYDGTTLTANLPETVYGGDVDFTNGVVTVTHGADGAELAEPYTLQIDPQQMMMLKGINHIRSDSGDTAITYIADTQQYIGDKIHEAISQLDYIENAGYAEEANHTTEADHAADADAVQGVDVVRALATVAPGIRCEASGALVTVADGAALPAVQAVTEISAVQSGSGDPSPDNVRPITGWDAVSLRRTGRNLLDASRWVDAATAGVTFVGNGDGSISVTGTNTAASVVNHPVSITMPLQPGAYVLSGGSTASGCYLVVAYRQGGATRYAYGGNAFTVDAAQTVTIFVQVAKGATVDAVLWPMLLAGDAAADFAAYEGVTLSTALPETVFGGRLDWTTGLLTVTHRGLVFDGTEDWGSNGSTHPGQFYLVLGEGWSSVAGACACSHYQSGDAYAAKTDQSVEMRANGFWLYDTGIGSNVADVKAYIAAQAAAATPVTVVYPLAAPYTVQLTPQQLDMLRGYNALWSDSGGAEVVYIADTKIYIDNAIAALAGQ